MSADSSAKNSTPNSSTADSLAPSSSTPPSDPLILTSRPSGTRVLIVQLNRPKVLNALSTKLIANLLCALEDADVDPDIGAIVITGNEKVFAAGADIKELATLSFPSAFLTEYLRNLSEGLSSIKKPVIAAVSGFALGGGLELALACDTIYASETASFGLPEVKIGTIPGAGGTQRLVRAIGKARAMHMILTGDTITSAEAFASGLVAKVVPPGQLLDVAIDAANKMASFSGPIVAMAKECVSLADQLSLQDGLRYERRMYHSTFATADFKEGMGAFLEKRAPIWKNV